MGAVRSFRVAAGIGYAFPIPSESQSAPILGCANAAPEELATKRYFGP
jgi:hypothetical protein